MLQGKHQCEIDGKKRLYDHIFLKKSVSNTNGGIYIDSTLKMNGPQMFTYTLRTRP